MKKFKHQWHIMLVFILSIGILISLPARADNVHNQVILTAAAQQLTILEQKNQLNQQRLSKLQADIQKNTKPNMVTEDMLQRAKLNIALSSANLDGTNITLAEAQQAQNSTQLSITTLENQLQSITLAAGKTNGIRERLTQLQAELNFQKTLSKFQQKQLDQLTINVELAQQIYDLSLKYSEQLNNLYQIKQKQIQQLALQDRENQLQLEQKIWLDKLVSLDAQLQNTEQSKVNKNVELQILEAQEQSNLIHLQIVILHLQEQVSNLEQQQARDVPGLNNIISQANDILLNVNNLKQVILHKQQLLNLRLSVEKQTYQQKVITKTQYEADSIVIENLSKNYTTQLNVLLELEQQTQNYLSTIQQHLNKMLARRQGLPGFSFEAWQSFGKQILHIPKLATESLLALKEQINLAYEKHNTSYLFLIIVCEFIWIGFCWLIHFGLKNYIKRVSRKPHIASNVLFVWIRLLKHNIIWFAILGAILLSFIMLGITTKSFIPFIALILVWLVFKIVVDAARFILLETSATVSAHDKKLYTELKYGLFIAGVVTMFMVLAHKLPVGYEVADFFNRAFMLFMLIISIVLLRSWKVVPNIVQETIALGRPYLMRLINLLSFLIPLTFFTTALIGFLGYVDFAWKLSRYEGLFLLVLTVYLLLRGLWNDIVEGLSEQCIRRFHNGWLYSQIIVKPIDFIGKIGLFLGIFVALYYLYNLTQQSLIIRIFNKILHFSLIQIKNAVITPLVILDFVIAGIIIYWVSRWTRELAFRWFFANSTDIGIRNSLSAFSQYSVVILGVLIALQVIGIDLTGISYVLGGLAFGAAFGLRDLVKNYASGLLMLIERPVRTGDLVSIGNHEGEVTHIGMRSMTVKTWDHLEVLVPNSETFDKPFTNWTHLDSIIRTVIHLKIAREDDPILVRDLILSVLEDQAYVVTDPPPQVYLMEMSGALMEFEVRYFINLQDGKSRAAVRSDILYAIYSTFKSHNIKLPYPPQDVYIRDYSHAEPR